MQDLRSHRRKGPDPEGTRGPSMGKSLVFFSAKVEGIAGLISRVL